MRKSSLLILLLSLIIAGLAAASPGARESFSRFEQRAENGDPEAQYRIALILERGWDSIPADSVRALDMLRRSANAGFAPAMNHLGYLYGKGYPVAEGPGLKMQRDSMFYWIRKSADLGDARAMSNLAFLLLEKSDENVNLPDEYGKNQREAIGYLEKASALGAPTAMSMLAGLYARGEGVAQDSVKAATLWLEAASKGLPDAEIRLISMMGRKWEKMDPDSAYLLGKKYYEGNVPIAGVILLERAATLPADSASLHRAANAMTMLGEAYSRGRGVRYDHDKALLWYAKGAVAGNPDAKREIEETERMFPDAMSVFADEIDEFAHQVSRISSAPR